MKRKLNVGYVPENSMMIKIIRSETIAILPVGIEEPHTTCVILSIENLIFTPVVFHNLSGHLFIKNLGFSKGNIDCIPNNEERYISFTKKIQVGSYTSKKGETKPLHHQIRLIDSFKFMAASLDNLVNNLPKDAFYNVKRYYKGDKLSLLTRKGVYPYEYMNPMEKLKETQLPPREAFSSRLNDEGIGDESYVHAQKVWKTFEMKNLEDYHNLYNQVDVLLLADVFENLKDI